MFSTGQWIFAALFAVSFIVLMIFSYKKDKKLHKKHYKGSFLVLLGFFGFVILLVVMKILLRQ
jgi:cytochrome bd-type quinol oxidase subunit 1